MLHCSKGTFDVTVPCGGKHTVYNALAAFAVADALEVAPEIILKQLSCYADGGLRQNIYKQADLLIFDDTYNAAPESMQASLGVMSAYPNRKIAVLADMLELGDNAPAYHEEVGKYAKTLNINKLVLLGELATYIGKGYGNCNVTMCNSREEINEYLIKKHIGEAADN